MSSRSREKELLQGIAVGDQTFLGVQDFDICPNLIKFYQIYPKFTQVLPIYPNLPKFCPNLAKKIARGCGRTPSSYGTVSGYY